MDRDYLTLALNLAAASGMVAATVLIHFWGLLFLSHLTRGAHARLTTQAERIQQALVILLAVFGVFALHTAEIWLYAMAYIGLGELARFEEALYFSTATFASLGSGDIVLSPQWRLLSAIEAANGLILFGWSTAFLAMVTSRLRFLEHEWLPSHRPPTQPKAKPPTP